jgi:hypothetical protein
VILRLSGVFQASFIARYTPDSCLKHLHLSNAGITFIIQQLSEKADGYTYIHLLKGVKGTVKKTDSN